MDTGRLKTAVLGLGQTGRLILEAASASEYFQILAVADKDSNLVKQTAQAYGYAGYDDYRQLLTLQRPQAGPAIATGAAERAHELDCLLVAAPLHSCDEYIRAAMKKKVHVLKTEPPGRSFEEAAELLGLAERQHVQFGVAGTARFAGSFDRLRTYLEKEAAGRFFWTARLGRDGGGDRRQSWQKDPKLAGGGVLLYNCYRIIDQIVLNFSLPQQVYAVYSSQASDRQQRQYLTEDTAVLTMKFADSSFGNLVASRCWGPNEQYLKVLIAEQVVTVSNNRFILNDLSGRLTEEEHLYEDTDVSCMTKILENFALSILSPAEHKLSGSGRELLKTMAVLEAAYLSGRTGMPEEPHRILQIAGRLDADGETVPE